MLFRTQIIFCSSELRLHFRIAEVGSLLSLNRAWRAQVTIGKSFVKITLQNSRPISKMIETFIAIWWGCLNKTFERRPPLCQHNSC